MNPITWLKNKFKNQEVKIEPVTSEPVITPNHLLIDRENFFGSVIKSFGSLKQTQIGGFTSILSSWEVFEPTGDLRHLAYMLATTWHETAKTMLPISEYGKGKGRKYGKPDPITGHVYYGRGYVQLTWAENYKKMGKLLSIDLYNNPDLALFQSVAFIIMLEGMMTRKSFKGDFTGVSLDNFFNKTKDDPIGARRIINGKDKAELIAGYYYKFLNALNYKKEV